MLGHTCSKFWLYYLEIRAKVDCIAAFSSYWTTFGVAGEYSWGSATLAFLYKELCTAAIRKSTEIADPVFILQLWP